MKTFQLLAGLFFICVSSSAFSQKITINGYITDKKSGERLHGASVYIETKGEGTTSNNYGFYSLTIPEGTDSAVLRISYTGYMVFTRTIAFNQDITLNAELELVKDLAGVTLTSVSKSALQNRTQMSSIELPVSTIKSLPAFLGEVDVLKAIQLLPGVQAGSEGSSGLYVRGGSPDQNLILLDGVPVYNASHLFGFFSVFNADALNSVEVMKGGFPARYGGRLSSVIDIRMKEGNKKEFHGEGGVGIVASRLMLEGPIGKKKNTSFMVSGRRTYIDLLAQPLIRSQTDGEVNAGYYFYDLNGKINFAPGPKDHIYLSGYFGNDRFYARDKYNNNGPTGAETSTFRSGLKWGNATAVARWNHEFSRKLFSNFTFYYSRYNFDVFADERSESPSSNDRYYLKYLSGVRDWSARFDADYMPNPNHFIKIGISGTDHYYKPGAVQSKIKTNDFNEDTLISYRFINAKEAEAYVEDDIRITPNLKANLGLHFTAFHVSSQWFTSLQPRLSLRYLITPEISVKASYVKMNQFIHLLTNGGIGLPTDLWVPVTRRIPPQLADQFAAGMAWNYKNKYEISVEGYYKKMNNLIEYAEGASYLNATSNWEDKVEIGKGWSYGAELFLQKKKGKTTGLIGYTLSWTNRRFENLNNGKIFPYRYDRRHDFKAAVVHKVSDRFEVSADWVYGTGQAITLPTEVYLNSDMQEVEVFDGRNGFRMKSFHRFDISAKFSKVKKRGTRSWIIGVYNAYNRQNPFFIFRDYDYLNNKPVFKQVSLFPIIPSVSYQFKF
ncbi:MAG: TonB-dependent receptor plug domain-containing protein [Bacteroidetes bacterium]|nr:TonB-dependent receptor plug domain-containing protein [Bacteroidota bacterium]